MNTAEELIEVSEVSNYYGCLTIKKESGKQYWSVENWDGHNWVEIPMSLYKAIARHAKKKNISK